MRTNLKATKNWLRQCIGLPLQSLAAALLFLVIGKISYSQNSVNILVTPPTTTVSLNNNFTVDVLVDFASGSLSGIDAFVNFNPTYLQVISTTVPAATQTLLPNESVPMTVNNTAGTVDHGRFIIGPSNHPNSDFVLFSIEFKALAVPPGGTTPVSFNTTGLRETNAVEGFDPDILDLITGATVQINNCVTPSATIAAASSSTTCNGQPVGLRLASASGVSPFSLVVNGVTYNNVTVGSTFATIPFPTHKIWPTDNPGLPRQNDGQAIEVGTKFRSSQTGFVKGVRFYSGSGSYTVSGTYKGKLWNASTGALLGSVTFTGVTKGAWQEVNFSTPISIAANTTYMVTCYSSAGNYVATDNYFTSAVTSGSITALANSTSTNGMFFFGTEQSGPTTNFNTWGFYQSTNYWVDVIFSPNTNSFNLTSVTDANGCNATGALQTLNVLSADCSTLPVTLINLSASPQGSKVTVKWNTSSEINNLGFYVERSTDGLDWTTLGFVQGAGNSSSLKSYSYLDNNLEPRKYFYRLKQVDIDQRYRYSTIVTATLNGKAEFVLGQNFPNPFNDNTTIQFTLPRTAKVLINLYDINGRMLRTLASGTKDAGSHVISLNKGTLAKGFYYYTMQADEFTDTKKLVIQ